MQSSYDAGEPAAAKRRTEEGARESSAARQQTFDGITVRDNAKAQLGDQYHNYHGPVYQSAISRMPFTGGTTNRKLTDALGYDGMDMRRTAIKLAYGNTGQWFFDSPEYKKWRDASSLEEHHGFLWIRGKPGAGKSTLMKLAVRHADETFQDDLRISFFFNAKGHLLEWSVEGMYRSLLHQLFVQCPELEKAFRERTWTQTTWPVELLEEHFRDCILRLGARKLTCHVDALDECEESDVRGLIEFFEDLGNMAVSAHMCLHVCFASRHYPRISISKCVHVVLDGLQGHQEDIETYVSNNLKVLESNTRHDFAREIRSRARDVFLWVVLVVRLLNKESDRGNDHSLRAQLDAIPDGLHDLFEDAILQRESDDQQHLMPTLLWMMFATRPLTPSELYHGVLYANGGTSDAAVFDGDSNSSQIEKFILNSSKGLAEIVLHRIRWGVDRPRVQFIHETVREYLQNGGMGRLESSIPNNPIGFYNDILRTGCVEYISLAARILRQPSQSLHDKLQASSKEDIRNMFPLLYYATRDLLAHAELAQAHGVSQVSFVEGFPFELLITFGKYLDQGELYLSSEMPVNRIYMFAASGAPQLLGLLLLEDEGGGKCRSRVDKVPGKATRERAVINSIQGSYGTPLLVAIARRSFDAVNLLLKYGADVNASRRSALACTMTGKNMEGKTNMRIFELLLKSGADVNAETRGEPRLMTVLQKAVYLNKLDMVRLLVGHGANLNAKGGQYNATPLQIARQNRYQPIVEFLLEQGALDPR